MSQAAIIATLQAHPLETIIGMFAIVLFAGWYSVYGGSRRTRR